MVIVWSGYADCRGSSAIRSPRRSAGLNSSWARVAFSELYVSQVQEAARRDWVEPSGFSLLPAAAIVRLGGVGVNSVERWAGGVT